MNSTTHPKSTPGYHIAGVQRPTEASVSIKPDGLLFLEGVRQRITLNIRRVNNMLQVHDAHIAFGTANKAEFNDDILRCVVLFLHASMEHFTKSLCQKRSLLVQENWLRCLDRRITIPSILGKDGSQIERLIQKTLNEYLEQKAFTMDDIKEALKARGIKIKEMDDELGRLEEMMRRRNDIAHGVDLKLDSQIDRMKPTPIQYEQVKQWYRDVNTVIDSVMIQLQKRIKVHRISAKQSSVLLEGEADNPQPN
jgi:hypothetical protein